MKVYTTLEGLRLEQPTAIALGYFDGLHKAHESVIGEAVKMKEQGCLACVFSFTMEHYRPPKKMDIRYLMDREQRIAAFEAMGVDCLILPDFSEIAAIPAEDFVRNILLEQCRARHIACGYDYRFGAKGAGTTALLEQLCEERGAQLHEIAPILYEGKPVSSTRIRQAIAEGDLDAAFAMSGHRFRLRGAVTHGKQLGRKLGFPTLNLMLDSQMISPKFGVYGAMVKIGDQSYKAIANIGMRPTVNETIPCAEIHLFDFDQEIYGELVTLELLFFVREEQKFDSVEELRAQIEKDCKIVADRLGSH